MLACTSALHVFSLLQVQLVVGFVAVSVLWFSLVRSPVVEFVPMSVVGVRSLCDLFGMFSRSFAVVRLVCGRVCGSLLCAFAYCSMTVR